MHFSSKPLQPFGELILEIAIPTNLSFKMPLVYRVTRELASHGYLPEGENPGIELALDEALTNAMIHGNRLDQQKKVRLRLFGDGERWGALIEDEGAGFSPQDLPRPDDPGALFREAGRGIPLIEANVEELVYGPTGSSVLLIQRRRAKAAPAAAPAAAVEPAPASVSVIQEGQVVVLTLHDKRITHDNLNPVQEQLSLHAGAARALVLDLQYVGYVSSAFLGALMAAYRTVRRCEGAIALAAVQPTLLEILKSVSLDRVFEFYPEASAASAALKERLGL